MRWVSRSFFLFLVNLCLVFYGQPSLGEPMLDVDRTVDKTIIHPGQPVEVTLTLTGDLEAQCASTALAVVLDVSGSLADWHGQLSAAIIGSLPYINFQNDQVAVSTFSEDYNILQGWQGSTEASVILAFTKLQAGGGTNIPNALRETNTLLEAAPGNPACKAALFITDGQDNCPAQTDMDVAKNNGWTYAFIGVGFQNQNVLKCMEIGTGGTYYDTTQPPYSNALDGAIRAAVDDFIWKALRIVAPSNIVVTEKLTNATEVTATEAPNPPPNQANPNAFAQAAASAWAALKTTGSATLPAIDRLDVETNGAVAEYSLHYTITVNECDPLYPTFFKIDAPDASVVYDLPGLGIRSVKANSLSISVHPCAVEFSKWWDTEAHRLRLSFTNHYPYVAEGFQVLEILNPPLKIRRAMPQPQSGGVGFNHARFDLPPLAPGASHEITLAISPSSPLPQSSQPFPVNAVKDPNFSFIVPWYATTISPASNDHTTLKQAIQTGVVSPPAKIVLEKAAYAVPHAHNTEASVGTPINQAGSTPWPGFDWRVPGTTGDFLIKSEGTSYVIYVAHRQWQYNFPPLPVSQDELNP